MSSDIPENPINLNCVPNYQNDSFELHKTALNILSCVLSSDLSIYYFEFEVYTLWAYSYTPDSSIVVFYISSHLKIN